MIINERVRPNCLSHTLSRAGIIPSEVYVEPDQLPECYGLEISQIPTSIFGILVMDEWSRWVLTHSMLIDASTKMVWQRPGIGKEEEVVTLEKALEPYSPSYGYFPDKTRYVYLRQLDKRP